MTQLNINKAYPALIKLGDYKLPVKKAYEIYKLIKIIDDKYKFAVEEEKKYIKQFNGKINADGSVSFENAESFGQFQERLAELNEMQLDINVSAVVLNEADLGNQTISPTDIFNLEGFVVFE